MSLVVLLILAVVWGVFLVPQILRARADRGPADSIGSFRNQLSMIERTLPGGGQPSSLRAASFGARPAPLGGGVIGAPALYPLQPPMRSELHRRRRDVLLALLAVVVFTLALGLLWTPLFALNIIADLALATYVALLVRARMIAQEREMKVRYLPGPAVHQPEPALLLRRSGS